MKHTPISIRHAEPTDYRALHHVMSGSQAIWGTLQLPFPSAERWRKRLAEQSDDTIHLVACAAEEVVGHLGLHTFPSRPRRRHVAQLGMAVRDDWQGKGVGSALLAAAVTTAEQWLNISRIELEVYTDNPAAVALYKKFGFVIEGTMTRYGFRNGEYVDAYMMARIAQN